MLKRNISLMILCLVFLNTAFGAGLETSPQSFSNSNSSVASEESSVSFAKSLFASNNNSKLQPRDFRILKDDSAIFCRDNKDYLLSSEPETVLKRYLLFFRKGSAAKSSTGSEMCAIYYRERYAHILLSISSDERKGVLSPEGLEQQYINQLNLLKAINDGSYVLDNHKLYADNIERKALRELISVMQEYWLTRFITFAYLERSHEFLLNGVGGSILTLGVVSSLVYFMAPKWSGLAMKMPRLLINLGMLARGTLRAASVGGGLGSSFAAASEVPDQYNLDVWQSPLVALDMPKDKITTETENVEKNMLLKDAYAIGGSVLTGYVGWHALETSAEKAAQANFVKALLEGMKKNGRLSKQVFAEAIAALNIPTSTEKVMLVMNTIKNSESMNLLVNGYRAMHGTAALGSLVITDVLLHYLKEWLREKTTDDLNQNYLESQRQFKAALQALKKTPQDEDSSLRVFTSAQKMFESMRLLISHLLIPAYEYVVHFANEYKNEQTIPMTCNIAQMNVASENQEKVEKFLKTLQSQEQENYLLAAASIEQFENIINDTDFYFFTTFFKHRLSLLKISFFFEEKFGLDTKKLNVQKNLKEFGKGYVRVLQGELAVNLQRMGTRLKEGIHAAKQQLGPKATPDSILDYLSQTDDLNYILFEKCLRLEKASLKK